MDSVCNVMHPVCKVLRKISECGDQKQRGLYSERCVNRFTLADFDDIIEGNCSVDVSGGAGVDAAVSYLNIGYAGEIAIGVLHEWAIGTFISKTSGPLSTDIIRRNCNSRCAYRKKISLQIFIGRCPGYRWLRIADDAARQGELTTSGLWYHPIRNFSVQPIFEHKFRRSYEKFLHQSAHNQPGYSTSIFISFYEDVK